MVKHNNSENAFMIFIRFSRPKLVRIICQFPIGINFKVQFVPQAYELEMTASTFYFTLRMKERLAEKI